MFNQKVLGGEGGSKVLGGPEFKYFGRREKQELKVRLASATAPDRLEALARERLGMRPPKPGQVVILP